MRCCGRIADGTLVLRSVATWRAGSGSGIHGSITITIDDGLSASKADPNHSMF
jgi:hypothetical protein